MVQGINPKGKRKFLETLRQANLGVREAQYELGLMYANGIGTAQNLSTAVEWIAKAANKGFAPAQYLLATRYALGIVLARDERAALEWYLRAAQQGHTKAQLALGRFFSQPHPELAGEFLASAANSGSADAQYAFARTHAVPADSLPWYLAAAQQGHARAQVELAKSYANGGNSPPDSERARFWLRAAMRQGLPSALVEMTALDERDPRSDTQAISHVRRKSERRQPAQAWAQQSATEPEEIFALGRLYEAGLFGAPDPERALELYRVAAQRDVVPAQCAVARLLAADQPAEAVQWAQKAASQGSLEGMTLAGALQLKGMNSGWGNALSAAAHLAQALDRGFAAAAEPFLELLTGSGQRLRAQCLSLVAREALAKAQAGDSQAQLAIGLQLLEEKDDHSLAEGRDWLETSARQGNHLAQWHLGGIFAGGKFGVKPDLKKAFYWCRLAAEGGVAAAQANLGYLYSRMGKHSLALQWLRKSARAGDPEGQFNLAKQLAMGRPSAADLEESMDWLVAASHQGFIVAQSELGLCYAQGRGVPVDGVEAHKWFHLAAKGGDKAARLNEHRSEAQLTPEQLRDALRRAACWRNPATAVFHMMK